MSPTRSRIDPSTSGAWRLTLRTSDPSFMLSPSTALRTGVAAARSQHATLRTGAAKTNPPRLGGRPSWLLAGWKPVLLESRPWQRAVHALGRTLRSFLADCRGAAALETALGTVVMVTATALFFDVYSLAAAKHTLLLDAVSMGDYASRDEQISATHIKDLAEFLYTENHDPLNAGFRVSAFTGVANAKASRAWEVTGTFGAASGVASDALKACTKVTPPPDELKLKAGETAIVARVCVEQDDKSGLHASYLIRSRADNPPQLVS